MLANRFEIIAELGRGAMGEVYRARDRARQEDIALKILPELDATALTRFKHEFRALHDIQHANLVAMHELHEDRGTWFFTMQLVDGVDFLAWVGDDEARMRTALGQVARALSRLHAAGLVHRDVKPSNIRVTADGRAILLDFGLVAPTWSPGEAAGTPAFMAPEQIEGDVTPAADWYALGVLVFRVLTGRLPFAGTPDEIMRAKLDASPPRVHALAPHAPPDLAQLADDLLALDPTARPAGPAVLGVLDPQSAPATFTTRTLVGRDHELARLRSFFTERMAGGLFAVSVAGESGIGKTTLLHAFAEELEQSGSAWVLSGRCWEREAVPYKGFDVVIDELATRLEAEGWDLDPQGWGVILVQAFPVLRRLPAFAAFEPAYGVGGRHTVVRVSSGVRWLLGEVAARQPLVIVIDDLQWADRDTLALVRGLLEPQLPNVLVVVGTREHGELARSEVRTLALGPLSLDETTLLVRMIASESGARVDTDAIARETAGHPLFAAELARHAATVGSVGSITFDAAVRDITARIGADAQHVMAIASLAHAPIAIDVAAQASEKTGAAFFATVSALRNAQLLASSGVGVATRIEVAHDRIRRAIADELATETRRELHVRIAGALEREHTPDAFALAHHWSEAGERARAAVHAMRAAEHAEAALAFHRAAQLYKWVTELDPTVREAPLRHAEALAQAGLGVDAAEAYLGCALRERGIVALDLRRRAMQQLLLMGDNRGLALFDELADELAIPNPRRPAALLVRLLKSRFALRRRDPILPPAPAREPSARELACIDVLWDATAALVLVDPLRSFYCHSLGLELAFRAGDRSRLARSLMGEAPYLAASGRPNARLPGYQRLADEVSKLASFPAVSPLCFGSIAFCYGRWRACRDALERTERLLLQDRPRLVKEGVGPTQLLELTRRFLLVATIHLGNVGEARRRVAEHLRDALERNDIASATHLRTGVQALVHLAGADIATAVRHADEGIAPWRTARIGLPHFMDVQARTNIDIYRGQGRRAHERIRGWWSRLWRAGLFRAEYVYVTMLDTAGRAALAAACEASGHERAQALRDARKAATKLHAIRARWSTPLGDALLGGIALAQGRSAAVHFARAASGFEHADMALHAAAVRFVAGREDARDEITQLGVVDVDAYTNLLLPR